jgi:hypothetical protein
MHSYPIFCPPLFCLPFTETFPAAKSMARHIHQKIIQKIIDSIKNLNLKTLNGPMHKCAYSGHLRRQNPTLTSIGLQGWGVKHFLRCAINNKSKDFSWKVSHKRRSERPSKDHIHTVRTPKNSFFDFFFLNEFRSELVWKFMIPIKKFDIFDLKDKHTDLSRVTSIIWSWSNQSVSCICRLLTAWGGRRMTKRVEVIRVQLEV